MREIGRPDHASTEQLSALLDDRAEPEDQAFVADHVEGCLVCAHELADLRSVRSLLRALPVYLPPRSFTIPVEVASPVRRFRRLVPLTRALSAIAAVLCVVLFAADAMQLGDRAAAPVPDGGAAFQITTAARPTAPLAKPALSAAEAAKPAEAARSDAPAAAAKPAEEPKPAAPAAAGQPADAAKSAFAPAATQVPSTAQTVAAVRTIVATPPAPAQAQPAPAARSAAAPAPPAQNADTSASASAPSAAAAGAPASSPPPAAPAAAAAQAPAPQAPSVASGGGQPRATAEELGRTALGAPGSQAGPTEPLPATATVPAVISGEPGLAIQPSGPVSARPSPWLSPVRLWALGLAIASAALLIGSFVLSRLAHASARSGSTPTAR